MWLCLIALWTGTSSFVSEWRTTSNNETVTLPFTSVTLSGMTVFWGDGASETPSVTPVAHTYSAPGAWNVTIDGPVLSWQFQNGQDRLKIFNIFSWDAFTLDSTSQGVFAGCANLDISATDQPIFSGVDVSLANMFAGCTSLNAPLSWDTSNVINMGWMFQGCSAFNSTLNFTSTATVTNMASMFEGCNSFNQPINFNTSSLLVMVSMFKDATAFDQPINFDTHNVNNMAFLFYGASKFNSPITFSDTSKVTHMTRMFSATGAFNQSLNLNTTNVQFMDDMFSGATSFDQPVTFDTVNVQTMQGMFYNATSFNHPVNFTTTNVHSMISMFEFASSFNQSVSSFNTQNVTDMSSMFAAARSFNQPISFDVRNVVRMYSMFSGASVFNHPIIFDSPVVTDISFMFSEAMSFNQLLQLNTSNVFSMDFMFRNAASFDQPMAFDTSLVVSMNGMFQGASKFNQPLSGFNVTQVQNMDSMFLLSNAFMQKLPWVSNASSCALFCQFCGLPVFLNCQPCSPILTSSQNWTVCNCPPGEWNRTARQCALAECPPPAYSGLPGHCICQTPYRGVVSYADKSPIGCDLCGLAIIRSNLQVGCLPPTSVSGPQVPVKVLSPLFNITANGSSGPFIFVLPMFPGVLRDVGEAGVCQRHKLQCEWLDSAGKFQSSGCNVTLENVALGDGVVGAECTCSHLTVFALVLREELHQEPLCQADIADYVLIALYGIVVCVVGIQLGRLAQVGVLNTVFTVHCVLLLASLLRLTFLVAKASITSVAALVCLGLLPSALTLSLFLHLLIAWASLQLFAMAASPFAKLRIPFVVIVVAVFVTTLIIIIVTAVAENPKEIVLDGSYLLAAMYAAVCILLLWSGLGLNRMLGQSLSVSNSSTQWRHFYRCRVLSSTVGLGFSLLLGAALWVAAVQADILGSSVATLTVSVLFYVSDLVSISVILIVYSAGVRAARKRKSKTTST